MPKDVVEEFIRDMLVAYFEYARDFTTIVKIICTDEEYCCDIKSSVIFEENKEYAWDVYCNLCKIFERMEIIE